MEIKQYIFKQMVYWLLVCAVSLIGIVWLGQALQLIELLVNKGAAFSQFLTIIAFTVPLWLMAILPIAGFAAAMVVLNKMAADREIIAMYTAGMSNIRIAIAPIFLGLLLTGYLFINSIYILPHLFSGYKSMINSLRTSAPIVTLQEGVFTDITKGLTIFINSRTARNSFENIFAHDTRDGDKVVEIIAESGSIDILSTPPKLKFYNGIRSEYTPGSRQATVLEFESYNLSLAQDFQKLNKRAFDYNELPISTLLAGQSSNDHYSREMRAEGHYRLASPLLGLSLVMIGVVAVLRSPYRRSDNWKNILTGSAIAIIFELLVITFRGLTVDHPAIFPLMYVMAGGPAILGLYLLRLKSKTVKVSPA